MGSATTFLFKGEAVEMKLNAKILTSKYWSQWRHTAYVMQFRTQSLALTSLYHTIYSPWRRAPKSCPCVHSPVNSLSTKEGILGRSHRTDADNRRVYSLCMQHDDTLLLIKLHFMTVTLKLSVSSSSRPWRRIGIGNGGRAVKLRATYTSEAARSESFSPSDTHYKEASENVRMLGIDPRSSIP